jgi:hypothetical protein
MSSTESSSNEATAPSPKPAPSKGSVASVVVSMLLLAALVWALRPPHPNLQPAPLRPQPSGCPKLDTEFVPTNYTEVPYVALDSLSKEQRNHVLLRLNLEPCTCGCNLSIAACLVDHPGCATCKELAQKIVAEERGPR